MPNREPLPDILRHYPLLLVAPHPDDAALSCAALLSRTEPIDVLTVFTGTPEPPRQGGWDRTTGFASSAESMPKRLAEERAAFAGTPHALLMLRALELQYATDETRSADADAIVWAISEWLVEHSDGIVALPAGAGKVPGRVRSRVEKFQGRVGSIRHPDHVFVRDIVLGQVRPDTILLYEEFPYLWGRSAENDVYRLANKYSRTVTPLSVVVDRSAKAARIATYATQVPHLRFGSKRVDVEQDIPEDERYWVLDGLTASRDVN